MEAQETNKHVESRNYQADIEYKCAEYPPQTSYLDFNGERILSATLMANTEAGQLLFLNGHGWEIIELKKGIFAMVPKKGYDDLKRQKSLWRKIKRLFNRLWKR